MDNYVWLLLAAAIANLVIVDRKIRKNHGVGLVSQLRQDLVQARSNTRGPVILTALIVVTALFAALIIMARYVV